MIYKRYYNEENKDTALMPLLTSHDSNIKIIPVYAPSVGGIMIFIMLAKHFCDNSYSRIECMFL